MIASRLTGDGEDPGADDGAEAEPDQVPPCEATLHVIATLFTELDELYGIRRPVEKSVLEARTSIRDCGSVRGEVLERGFREEVSLAPSPVASGYVWFFIFLRPYIHGVFRAKTVRGINQYFLKMFNSFERLSVRH